MFLTFLCFTLIFLLSGTTCKTPIQNENSRVYKKLRNKNGRDHTEHPCNVHNSLKFLNQTLPIQTFNIMNDIQICNIYGLKFKTTAFGIDLRNVTQIFKLFGFQVNTTQIVPSVCKSVQLKEIIFGSLPSSKAFYS